MVCMVFVASGQGLNIEPQVLPRVLIVAGALIAGVTAAVTSSRVFHQQWWWSAINLGFPGAIVAGLTIDVSPWVYLTGFVVLLMVNWNASTMRVPLYLTNRETWAALSQLIPVDKPSRFIDLGSGLGGTLYALAKSRPDCQFTGYETAPIPFLLSRLREMFVRLPNVTVRYCSIWQADLSRFDVVYCFLSPAPMTRVFDKARSEMHPGSILISNSFSVDGHDPGRIVIVDDDRKTNLLIWQM
ncbi:MAG: class I SAM-dependent methyltransferase [Rhodospirillales bacterium]|jgi:hypothetical protein|nr:class I SAM-dependent methyltransferase [Rhodospirillales bacterium]MBT4041664.1 class I SAM-dependent methyltransferase [Rhodospirillales bacterium]MBT4628115.1 class I SAM-dependent methyltransferase [Rhodospirillales bacterium]MBT5350144.1 class I SAM-dependent methyltransferase [Rhodospirillales bacterium]MBT5521010.1 class I SAM-dependent methyltransferase [Rhodospirillales bacterium]